MEKETGGDLKLNPKLSFHNHCLFMAFFYQVGNKITEIKYQVCLHPNQKSPYLLILTWYKSRIYFE